MDLRERLMKTQVIPKDYKHIAPDGAEIRELLDNEQGGIAHCILKEGKVSKAVKHKTVSEFWHILSGKGEIWRRKDGQENITTLGRVLNSLG